MSEPIRDLETAVRELGALPMPVGPEPQMPPEQRVAIAELIGDAKPATGHLVEQLAKSVRDRREHEHPTWEDLYCLNLVSWMGERMGPVLRRLLDAEARAAELRRQRNAFRDQRDNVFATNEQLLAKVDELGQARLRAENETRTVKRQFAEAAATVADLVQKRGERLKVENALRDRVAELEQCQRNQADNFEAQAALIRQAEARVAELEAQNGTALPWAHTMSDDDLHEFLGDLVSAAMGRWQHSPEVPDREVLAAVEKACAAWRRPGHGYRSDELDAYPPALPWARLMDHEDLTGFLDELAASAITHATAETALAEVEKTCGTWRLIAEAQHAHNTAPGPDAEAGDRS
ncbi:hypothetical protein ACIQ6R_06170 [Streptomyces sp. NPDC096048]|uniref:hypothetical protein n=1 Tax=Streptomyces sp. NPDC096048 TaxID=3366072 RepID=UPI00381C1019